MSNDRKIIIGDDGEIESDNLEIPEKKKRKRKAFRRPFRFIILATISGFLLLLSSIGILSLYYLSKIPGGMVSQKYCANYVNQIGAGGDNIIFQVKHDSPNQAALDPVMIMSLDGFVTDIIRKPTQFFTLDVSDDLTRILESHYDSALRTSIVTTQLLTDFEKFTGKQLVTGNYASLSPDGSRIAFFEQFGGRVSELILINADGSGLQHIAQTHIVLAPASWSPDSSQLAFSTSESDDTLVQHIHIIDINKNSEPIVIKNSLSAQFPAWSPDGKQIAYTSQDVYIVNVDGSNRRNLTNGQFATSTHPVWASDAQSLAFIGIVDYTYHAIFRMDNDGTGLRTLYEPCPR